MGTGVIPPFVYGAVYKQVHSAGSVYGCRSIETIYMRIFWERSHCFSVSMAGVIPVPAIIIALYRILNMAI
jgi:hypothetical protein